MTNKIFLFLILILSILGCSDASVRISGKLENAVKGQYLFLQELKSNELTTVDSLKLKEDGSFSFNREITLPTFYLLKTANNNFFTLLLEPGEKVKIEAMYDSLNYP